MDTLALKIDSSMKLILLLFVLCMATACTKTTKNTERTQPMDAILDGTFATDTAMQEERVEQGDYIDEQENRYE
jgi:hypothetical protein